MWTGKANQTHQQKDNSQNLANRLCHSHSLLCERFGTERRCARDAAPASAFQKASGFDLVRRMYTRERGQLQSFLRLSPRLSANPVYDYPPAPSYTIPKITNRGGVMNLHRSFFAVVFLALTVSVVNAYTVVMRDGRRVEIPNEFTVTNSTLTYEAGNGIQITIQLNAVDIAATERANSEAQGSFRMKANAPKVPVEAISQTRRASAVRKITNADLEKYRTARVESEKRRQELGLPSLEERQREVA